MSTDTDEADRLAFEREYHATVVTVAEERDRHREHMARLDRIADALERLADGKP